MFRLLITLFLLLSSSLFPAAPATHLLLTEHFLQQHNVTDRESFIVGTLFPDIRYLGTLPRKATHEKNVTLDMVLECPSSFQAGMLFHAYVDEIREIFLQSYEVQLTSVPQKWRVDFLKLLEDEIYWELISGPTAQNALSSIYKQELLFVNQATAEQWHQLLSRYFTQKPSIYLRQLAEEQKSFLNIPPSVLVSWRDLLQELAQHPHFQLYTEQLLAHFDAQFVSRN